MWRAWPPDWVAFPRNEDDISELMDFAAGCGAALIPFGGGTSVCGGVEPDVGGDYGAVISVDLQYLNQVMEVDKTSRAALIEGGALGPELEAALKPHGLTLRHFPQSFAFSTLGGWVATRAGGHFASNYTHIDDFVESVRMLTPSGVMESRRLPGSGAGPSPDRMMIGSEGTLGFITRAWMRLQARPRYRASASVTFPGMREACNAVRWNWLRITAVSGIRRWSSAPCWTSKRVPRKMASTARALDPQGMMNPGVLIDTPARGATAGGIMKST